MGRYRIAWACLALVACMGEGDRGIATEALPPAERFAGGLDRLRVLSYNVKALPWVIAGERDPQLEEIGARLAAMRRAGQQPNVVVLQEAFAENARQIGLKAGYRHSAFGPELAPARAAPPMGERYAREASWLKGEALTPVMDSGLALFSDFPIERVDRLAFPQGACAGFDCLASKGVLIAWIRIPGRAEPVAVATTHLNSRKASGVSAERANRAFAWQFARIRELARRQIGESQAAIFAGDFNLAGDEDRASAARRIGSPLAGGREAISDTLARGAIPSRHLQEARAADRKGTDQQFYRSGRALKLEAVALDIPFPETGTDDPLSDHPGLMVDYRLSPARDRT